MFEERSHCPVCGCWMTRRKGKNGDFYGCMRYPECKGVKNCCDVDIPEPLEEIVVNDELTAKAKSQLDKALQFIAASGSINEARYWLQMAVRFYQGVPKEHKEHPQTQQPY